MLLRILLMAFTIATNVAGIASTGRPNQGHVCYAPNQGAWWAFFPTSTQSLSAAYSTNGGSSWSTPTGSPITLTAAHGSEGRNFGFASANLASTDVLHLSSVYVGAPSVYPTTGYHSRYTLGTTWTQTNSEATVAAAQNTFVPDPSGNVTVLDSTGAPVDAGMWLGASKGTPGAVRATGTDSGSAWTAGWGAITTFGTSTVWNGSAAIFSLGSGNVLLVYDNSSGTVEGHNGYTNLSSQKWGGSSWASAGTVSGTAFTATSPNQWGACARSAADIHVVSLSDNASSFAHCRYNGSTWSSGDTIPTLAIQQNTTTQQDSGISLVTDGTNVWAAAIDSSGNVKYTKWTSGSGWSAWTVLEATRTTPGYITGAYNGSNAILWAWTENTGSQFNVVGSTLSTSGGGGPAWFPRSPFPSIPPAFLTF